MRKYVSNINPGNAALEFIDRRLADDKYRGERSSQHNRYTRDELIRILTILDKYAPSGTKLQIRTTDISKRRQNLTEEEDYSRFCSEVKSAIGKGTQDAMRKNLFVDFHRMGLITRYDKRGIATDPYRQQQVKFVSLSEQGMRLVHAASIDEQHYIFSSGVDTLLGGFISDALGLLRSTEFNLRRISIHEFMFFVSAIGTSARFNIGWARCAHLIHEYRNLSTIQRRSVIEVLRDSLQPSNFVGDKTSQRDFHNWKNKIEQIYHILDQTVYFEVSGEMLFLRRNRVRSYSHKKKYFEQHRVERTPGFELHHVVPLGWAESEGQFKLFDDWQNMVYISAFVHAQITQNRNRNVCMAASHNDLILSDYGDNSVHLKSGESLLYNPSKQPILLEYNERLRRSTDLTI